MESEMSCRSPSSGTALAESELEYKEDHSSIAAYFRFKVSIQNTW